MVPTISFNIVALVLGLVQIQSIYGDWINITILHIKVRRHFLVIFGGIKS